MASHQDTDAYIAGRTPPVAAEMQKLRDFIHAEMPDASEAMQYGVPVFLNSHGVPVIYLFGAAAHVNFGFLRAADLSDPDGQLIGSGKPSKHIKLQPGAAHDQAILRAFIAQCADLKPDTR